MSEPGSGVVHLAQRLGFEVEVELRDEAQGTNEAKWVILEARRPDGAQQSPFEIVNAAKRVDEAAVREPTRHRVDREVATGHVLLELDRGVADDREVAVPRTSRPLRAWRCEVDAGRHERPHRSVVRV